jgi:hypothetical protein
MARSEIAAVHQAHTDHYREIQSNIDAGTIAVNAPAPAISPRNHAGKPDRTIISRDKSPLLKPGVARTIANRSGEGETGASDDAGATANPGHSFSTLTHATAHTPRKGQSTSNQT